METEKAEKIEKIEKKGTWLTYRPDIKIVDCTIRDGGLVNDFNFQEEFVAETYRTCINAGIDYMEVGYKASKKIYSPSEFGRWKFCDEDDMRRLVGDKGKSLGISVMADADRTDYREDILPKEKSIADMVRVATYIHQIPSAIDLVKDAHDKGYETTINLMSISLVSESELDQALEILAQTEVKVIYLVDSFGALYSEQIRALASKYLKIAESCGKLIGIHTHNNQQLAYSNTVEALILGASYLDATIAGFGRGAGNCPIELLLGFLKNPRYHIRPILEFIQNYIVPLRQTFVWGFDIPYMITGQLNMHPKSAIDFYRNNKNSYTEFYDMLMSET